MKGEETIMAVVLNVHDAVLFPGLLMTFLVDTNRWQALSSSNRQAPIALFNIQNEALCEGMTGCLSRILRVEKRKSVEGGGRSGGETIGGERIGTVTIAGSGNKESADGSGSTFHRLLLQGVSRIKLRQLIDGGKRAVVEEIPESVYEAGSDRDVDALVEELKVAGGQFIQSLKTLHLPDQMMTQLHASMHHYPPGAMADFLAAILDCSVKDKLTVLQAFDLKSRLTILLALLEQKNQANDLALRVRSKVDENVLKQKREFILRQQLKAIQQELGQNGESDDIRDLRKRMDAASLSPPAHAAADRELKRLAVMQPSQTEYSMVRTYLEWLLELPWMKSSDDSQDFAAAQRRLDHDHFGLKPVKERILQFLAVKKLTKNMHGPILCFEGPPGVGKTSLGKSVADALGRQFHRISLGGVSDESEIRGHRRTYIASLPGLIIQAMKKVGVNNPVILLDELDKVGSDRLRGDPAAALLEVLDGEQNRMFEDRYLNVPFDLSNVLFIATANTIDTISRPLLDRLEILHLPGYTDEEKSSIASRHLIPKQLKLHGLTSHDIIILPSAILTIINNYTQEPGVRNLERQFMALFRFIALERVRDSNLPHAAREINASLIERILGSSRYAHDVAELHFHPGMVYGLAFVQSGAGSILTIESSCYPGDGKLQLTGRLGDVMRESVLTALSWTRSNAHRFRFNLGSTTTPPAAPLCFSHLDFHVHFPSGSTRKDGPSAGIAIVVSLISLLTGTVCPFQMAMTGEVTLRGRVLPVGGIREKVLAAYRAGIRRVILPDLNKKEVVEDVPDTVKSSTEFVYVRSIDDAISFAFPDHPNIMRLSSSL